MVISCSIFINAADKTFISDVNEKIISSKIIGIDNKTPDVQYSTLSNDETYFTLSDGSTVPNLLKSKVESDNSSRVLDPMRSLSTGNISSYEDDFHGDSSGVYWSVVSKTGYYMATAFIKLPLVMIDEDSDDVPYMMFSVNQTGNVPNKMYGDYGIYYKASEGRWYACSGAYGIFSNGGTYGYNWAVPIALPENLTASTQLYLQVKVTRNTSNRDTVTLYVKDGTCSTVLATMSRDFYGNPIDSTCSNIKISRAITMAQHHPNDQSLNTNTGTYMIHARFLNSYLYSSNGYYQWTADRTSAVRRRAPSEEQLETVNVYSYSMWYAENISIHFNVPN